MWIPLAAIAIVSFGIGLFVAAMNAASRDKATIRRPVPDSDLTSGLDFKVHRVQPKKSDLGLDTDDPLGVLNDD